MLIENREHLRKLNTELSYLVLPVHSCRVCDNFRLVLSPSLYELVNFVVTLIHFLIPSVGEEIY